VLISISPGRPISRSPTRDGPSSPSVPSKATAELEYGRTIVFFRWTGFDEGDEISGDGSAELQDDGTIEVELSFDNGDDAILTGRRE